jgi:hypothetical protein
VFYHRQSFLLLMCVPGGYIHNDRDVFMCSMCWVGLLYIAYVTKTIGCPTLLSYVNFIGLLIEDNETRHVRERYTISAAVSSVLCGKKLTSLLFVLTI